MSGRRFFVAMYTIGCLWLAEGCTNSSQNQAPPSPPVVQTTDGTKIPVVPAGYQYSSGSSGVVADSPAPQVLLKGKKPVFVKPGEPFRVDFGHSPTAVQVTTWKEAKLIYQSSTAGPWNFERMAGVYYYEVTAWWGKDYAAYDFLIEVK